MSATSGKPGDPSDRSGRPRSVPPPSAEQTAQIHALSAGNTRAFGKYRLLAELGRGGMADVHLAVSVGPAGFSKLQVIKRLRPGMTDEAEMRSMMLDEARLAARLNHKNIVQTNEVGIENDQYFLAMEYLDGQPYHRVLKRCAQLGRTVPLPFAVKILCEVLSGLHYAHEVKDYDGHPLGVVHRDVSPQNIFITYDGQVKVVDFGIAKAARRLVETQTGIIRGKLTYMAPEQAFANEIDRRADVFSVGVLLWEAVAGERLWGQLSDPEIVARMMHEIPSVTTVRPDAPADLAELATRALSRKPEGRPATAGDMRQELEVYLATHDIQVNAEALGALVADLFADEREELQRLVDRELAILRVEGEALERSDITNNPWSSPASTSPSPGATSPKTRTEPSGIRKNLIPGSPGVPSGMRIPGTPPPPSIRDSQRNRAVTADEARPPDSMGGPTIPKAPAFDSDEGMTSRELSPPVAVLSNAPGPPSSVTFPSALSPIARPGWRKPLVYGAALALAAGAAFLVGQAGFSPQTVSNPAATGTPTGDPPPSAPSSAAPAPTATESAPATSAAVAAPNPDTNYVRIRITTNPAQSRILVDNSPLPPQTTPFEGKFVKDGAVHRITVEATGFYPQSRMIVFDRDQTMDFFLHSKKGLPPPKDNPYR
jgi:serine/threonine protein kinase